MPKIYKLEKLGGLFTLDMNYTGGLLERNTADTLTCSSGHPEERKLGDTALVCRGKENTD